MHILLPKDDAVYTDETLDLPHFFLAGPIRGGGDWQKEMCLILDSLEDDCVIICPCRWTEEHALRKYFFSRTRPNMYDRQLTWERYYLEHTSVSKNKPNPTLGCTIFWLPCESKKEPHPGPEPYAMDTRGELGEWRVRMKYEKARVVIGGDYGFHGLSQIGRNFSQHLGYEFTIHSSMKETAKAAVRRATSL